MNKLKKVLLILFIFIIAIVAIVALEITGIFQQAAETIKTEADLTSDASVSSSAIVKKSVGASASSVFDGSVTIDGIEYYYNETTGGYGLLANNWWILCCHRDWHLKNLKVYFREASSYSEVTPIYAYLLSYMQSINSGTYRAYGQFLWWNAGSGTIFNNSTEAYSYDLVVTGDDLEDYLSGVKQGTKSVVSFETFIWKDVGESYAIAVLEELNYSYKSLKELTSSQIKEIDEMIESEIKNISTYEEYENLEASSSIWFYIINWSMGQEGYSIYEVSDEEATGVWASAVNFQSYIFEMLGISNVNALTSSYYKEYTVDGKTVNGYDIDGIVKENFQFVDASTDVTVNVTQEALDDDGSDANSFVVGPFKLGNYVYNSEFSYITSSNLKILKYDQENETTSETSLSYENGEYHFRTTAQDGLDENGFPKGNTEFYIVFEYDSTFYRNS